jgi:hypothetical protein
MPRFNIHLTKNNSTYPFIGSTIEQAVFHVYEKYGEEAWENGDVEVEFVLKVKKQKFK